MEQEYKKPTKEEREQLRELNRLDTRQKVFENLKEAELKLEEPEENIFSEKNCEKVLNAFKFDLKTNFGPEFAHIEDTEAGVSLKIKPEKKKHCMAFGIVIYATKNFYVGNPEADACHHIYGHFDKEDFIKKVMVFLKCCLEYNYHLTVSQIICGHEHGTTTKKCHFQIIVELEKEATGVTVFPGEFTIEGQTMLFMSQKARNSHALKQYCKKDKDFYYLCPEKAIKLVYKVNNKGEVTNKVDPFATVVANPEMTKEQKMDTLLAHDPRIAITHMKNIEYALDKLDVPVRPDFEWIYPKHCKDFTQNGWKMEYYQTFNTWYYNYCVPDLPRRKALLIYGKPGCGKTELAKRLVSHESYYCYFRAYFHSAALIGKDPKLLILDDMAFMDPNKHECFKALLTGESCQIRDCFMNFPWNFNVPCVMITNKKSVFRYIYTHEEFKSRCVYMTIDEGDFLGPPDTKPENFDSIEGYVNQDLLEYIDMNEIKKSYEQGIIETVNIFKTKKRERSRDNSPARGHQIKRDIDSSKEISRLKERIEELERINSKQAQVTYSATDKTKRLESELEKQRALIKILEDNLSRDREPIIQEVLVVDRHTQEKEIEIEKRIQAEYEKKFEKFKSDYLALEQERKKLKKVQKRGFK